MVDTAGGTHVFGTGRPLVYRAQDQGFGLPLRLDVRQCPPGLAPQQHQHGRGERQEQYAEAPVQAAQSGDDADGEQCLGGQIEQQARHGRAEPGGVVVDPIDQLARGGLLEERRVLPQQGRHHPVPQIVGGAPGELGADVGHQHRGAQAGHHEDEVDGHQSSGRFHPPGNGRVNESAQDLGGQQLAANVQRQQHCQQRQAPPVDSKMASKEWLP